MRQSPSPAEIAGFSNKRRSRLATARNHALPLRRWLLPSTSPLPASCNHTLGPLSRLECLSTQGPRVAERQLEQWAIHFWFRRLRLFSVSLLGFHPSLLRSRLRSVLCSPLSRVESLVKVFGRKIVSEFEDQKWRRFFAKHFLLRGRKAESDMPEERLTRARKLRGYVCSEDRRIPRETRRPPRTKARKLKSRQNESSYLQSVTKIRTLRRLLAKYARIVQLGLPIALDFVSRRPEEFKTVDLWDGTEFDWRGILYDRGNTMPRKQFDRMELLTDETEVDRTFLHSKLRAIIRVSLLPHLSAPSAVPWLQLPNPSGSPVQVTSTRFCKNLGMTVG